MRHAARVSNTYSRDRKRFVLAALPCSPAPAPTLCTGRPPSPLVSPTSRRFRAGGAVPPSESPLAPLLFCVSFPSETSCSESGDAARGPGALADSPARGGIFIVPATKFPSPSFFPRSLRSSSLQSFFSLIFFLRRFEKNSVKKRTNVLSRRRVRRLSSLVCPSRKPPPQVPVGLLNNVAQQPESPSPGSF
jgi:hypothetical protein